MTYKDITERLGELAPCVKDFPLVGENENKINSILEHGENEGGRFYKLTTLQKNGRMRINIYHEDGTTEEIYEK